MHGDYDRYTTGELENLVGRNRSYYSKAVSKGDTVSAKLLSRSFDGMSQELERRRTAEREAK